MTDQPFESTKAMKSFISDSVNELSDLFKILYHPKRLLLLSTIMDKRMDFASLLEETDLPKTALSNHLTALIEKNLIEKVDRGVYSITYEGEEVLRSVANMFLNMKINQQERLRSQREKDLKLISQYTHYRFIDDELEIASIHQARDVKKMEVKIETKPAFSVLGLVENGKEGPKFIPPIWEKLNSQWQNWGLDTLRISKDAYGVMSNFNKDSKRFDYNASVKVNPNVKIPAGLSLWHIPEQQYAVVNCKLNTIMNAYEFLFKEWFKEQGYEHSMGPEFEYYPEDWHHDPQNNTLYLYIPIKKV